MTLSRRAACADLSLEQSTRLFFGTGRPPRAAKEMCAGCPVRLACLTVALEAEGQAPIKDRVGMYAGLGPGARVRISLGGRVLRED